MRNDSTRGGSLIVFFREDRPGPQRLLPQLLQCAAVDAPRKCRGEADFVTVSDE